MKLWAAKTGGWWERKTKVIHGKHACKDLVAICLQLVGVPQAIASVCGFNFTEDALYQVLAIESGAKVKWVIPIVTAVAALEPCKLATQRPEPGTDSQAVKVCEAPEIQEGGLLYGKGELSPGKPLNGVRSVAEDKSWAEPQVNAKKR